MISIPPATTLTTFSADVIQSRIDLASPGDTIFVDPGIYIGAIDFTGKDISLISNNGPDETILDGELSRRVVSIGPGGSIEGFSITRGRASFGAGMEVNGIGTVIAGNVFYANIQTAGGSGAAIDLNNSSPLITGNLFRNNDCDDQFVSGVISLVNTSEPTISNNIFRDNTCRGVNLTLPAGRAAVIVNNTFVDNDVGIRVDRRVSQNSVIIRNNIIVNNVIGLEVDFGSDLENPVWENNLVFNNGLDYEPAITDPTGTNGNIAVDPQFVDEINDDFHLQTGSPAIDSGSNTLAPADDYDGNLRPLDGDGDTSAITDIGAFEAPAL